MRDANGFRAYESAIISGLLSTGEYTLESIQGNLKGIRATARKFSGGVSEAYYPVGVHWMEVDAAQHCVYRLLSKPTPLTDVVSHLKSAGFEERVIRYAYTYLLDRHSIAMLGVDGVPMLSREVRK